MPDSLTVRRCRLTVNGLLGVLACMALGKAASASGPRWMDLTEERKAELMEEASSRPLPERLIKNSERFVGTPYVHSPLGNGKEKDEYPLLRFDAVDCVTFVEQTISLSLAKKPEDLEGLLKKLRYANEPTFEDRNHLMEAQWIPHNIEKGFIRDLTRTIAGSSTLTVSKRLTRATWASKSSRALGLSADRQPIGSFRLQIIPLGGLMGVANAIPSGTILVVVREDRPYKVTRVSHLGFVLHKKGQTYLRHATTRAGKVVDEELGGFLLRNSKYEKWRVVGASLFEVLSAPSP